MQAGEGRARIDAQLVRENGPGLGKLGQRVALPVGPVQRQHQLLPEPLAQRMLGHQRGQLGDHGRVPAEREIGGDPVLDGLQAQGLEPRGVGAGERLGRELAERRPMPFGQRRGEMLARGGRVVGEAPGRGQALELAGVQLAGADLQAVAALRGDDADLPGRPQRGAQFADAYVNHLGGAARGSVAPQGLGDPIGRDGLARGHQQDGEQPAVPRTAERKRRSVVHRPNRAQDLEFHDRPSVTYRSDLISPEVAAGRLTSIQSHL